ncbi:hypothetical protein Syun_009742 [Stephania yunnanensis]|uniref:Uncharacterized protein n=1 Tax=Stephania yunnanensis TaxID=152371 RepID=A0AAP0PNV8_9MAGN
MFCWCGSIDSGQDLWKYVKVGNVMGHYAIMRCEPWPGSLFFVTNMKMRFLVKIKKNKRHSKIFVQHLFPTDTQDLDLYPYTPNHHALYVSFIGDLIVKMPQGTEVSKRKNKYTRFLALGDRHFSTRLISRTQRD